MARLEAWLNRVWYGTQKPNAILRALSGLYGWLLRLQPAICTKKLTVPVLVIGNFTVGGTGKTPLIIALVQHFQMLGLKPGVISRGYARKTRHALSVLADSTADTVGDEPLLIARRTQVPVRVDRHRRNAAEFLIAQGCTIILSDDGLQHRALARTLEIEVFDAQRLYGNGLLLPAGPLREPVRATALRVGNGLVHDSTEAFALQLKLNQAYGLHSGEKKTLQDFLVAPVHAVAGIGHPERFFSALRALGLHLIEQPYADHHDFQEHDFKHLLGPILMTEKDAVKCQHIQRLDIWVVPVDAFLSPAFYQTLQDHMV